MLKTLLILTKLVVMKILIVEDDIVSRELLRVVVQKEGYECQFAEDGIHGLELFHEFKPDVVITDIRMPRLDGIGLLQRIRSVERNVIIIIVTAHGNEEIALQALHLGANNYLKKPINLEDLRIILTRYDSIILNKVYKKDISILLLNQSITMVIDSDFDLVPSVSEYLTKQVKHIFSGTDLISIELGISELLLNAIEHGSFNITNKDKEKALQENNLIELYNARKQDEKYANRKITILFNRNQNYCEWTIADEGNGFNWKYIPSPFTENATENLHGRGVYISKLQFDSIDYSEKGNSVTARKKIKQYD